MTGKTVTLRLGASNVYVLPAGDTYVVIDAGPDYEGAWESATAQMAAAGIAPQAVGVILVTHGHVDHCTLSREWQKAGAEVWIAREDARRLTAGGRDPGENRRLALDSLAANGVPDELVSAARAGSSERSSIHRGTRMGRANRDEEGRLGNLRSIAADHGEWPAPLQPTSATPDRVIAGEGAIAIGSSHLRPIRCPGHTPGSLVFLDEDAGDLYTGDHVLERIAPTPGIHFTDAGERIRSLPQYLRSLAAVRDLGPRRVLPGHGEPFVDLAGAVDRTTGVFEQRATRLLRRLNEGPASAWELALRLYPHLRPSAAWIVMAEVIGLLDLLEERRLIHEERGEQLRFAPRG